MKCPKCNSDNTRPSFSIPTWKCLDCGHIYPGEEMKTEEEIRDRLAFLENDLKNHREISGIAKEILTLRWVLGIDEVQSLR